MATESQRIDVRTHIRRNVIRNKTLHVCFRRMNVLKCTLIYELYGLTLETKKESMTG